MFEEAADVVLLSGSSKREVLVSEEEGRHFEWGSSIGEGAVGARKIGCVWSGE